tara:strand:+ start:763 stop:1005 length:243 start_codon:yes stop_codon:yes gene_type:complete
MLQPTNKTTRGFSKLELVIVLMIIGLAVFLAIPIYNSLTPGRLSPQKESSPASNQPSPASSEWNSGLDANETPVRVLNPK